MDNRRLLLLAIFGFSLMMLWSAWEKEHQAPVPAAVASSAQPASAAAGVPVPTTQSPTATVPAASVVSAMTGAASPAPKVTARTDVVVADISAQGGDLVRLELLKHKATGDAQQNLLIFDSGEKHFYEGQSGLIGSGMPNHKTLWQLVPGIQELKEGEDSVRVVLQAPIESGGKVVKTYTFHRSSYLIDIDYQLLNQGHAPQQISAYFQITRDGKPAEVSSSPMMGMGASTFTGPAVYTEKDKYQKVNYADIDKGKAKYATNANDGWIALVQHYFVSAWLPKEGAVREFYIRKLDQNLYSAGVIVPFPAVTPGASANLGVQLYAGPQEQDKLKQIAPGLNLVVDYGWLAVIAQPIFWVMELIHRVVGNWGWSIILLTVLIKAAFFPLSAASYKSMAKMRVVTPKMTKLKEMYGDDRARLNQEMMELYKKEKINPLGGCLPIMVQIPVFISLYWVLLGAVEMRNAPWLGWITDLSVKDPFFVLPLIMGATMLIQTKLNPTPPDPMQAKVMMIMPIVFTGMFLFFPSGLVLYWVVNNVLSIAQQWQITRMIEGGKKTT